MLGTWRSKVEKDLGGVAFERALVTEIAGGLRMQPLYESSNRTPQRISRLAGLTLARIVYAGAPLDDLPAERWVLGPAEPGEVSERAGESGHVVQHADRPTFHALDVHDAGGSAPLEIAVAVGRVIDALRGGASPPELSIAVASGTEIFLEVAKLRAIRALAERCLLALGAGSRVRILARTSFVGFSRIEPETNALRATLSTVAGMLGGADLVAVAPYDVLAPSAGPHDRASRLAGTTGLVASLEAHLAGAEDPLHGAYPVEALTRDLMDAAWSIVRGLERSGGANAAAGSYQARLADEGHERQRAARAAQLPRVGASRLARVEAPMLGAVHPSLAHVLRDTAAFERLREDRIVRPTTILVVGDPKKTAARAEYLREVLATWGAPASFASLAAIDAPLERGDGASWGAVAVCAEDRDFGALSSLVRTLSSRAAVLVAGRPGPHEAALREAGAAAFVHLGADLPAVARALYGDPRGVGASAAGGAP